MSPAAIFLYEFKHFSRNKFKVIGFALFLLACAYGLSEGYRIYSKHNEGISAAQASEVKLKEKTLQWYDEGKTGPEDRPWIDITTPFWALWNTPTNVFKQPSPLMPLSVGQAEQYGYYKQVTTWSSPYDSDMIEEIANPERLAVGGVDFTFAVIFLAPLLLIILTYNLGGLEQDLAFLNLIEVQTAHVKTWLLFRLSFYLLLVLGAILVMILGVAVFTDAYSQSLAPLLGFISGTGLYLLVWGVLLYLLIRSTKGSNMQAFKMIATWLTLCVLLPGTVHQYVNLRFPAAYMTDFLDASRKSAYEIYELPNDSLAQRLMVRYPDLKNTKAAQDTVIDEEAVSNSVSALVNTIVKAAVAKVEDQNTQKNHLIEATYWINPVSFFNNWLSGFAQTDYHAYQAYRNQVQATIDKKIMLMVHECWSQTTVDKATYLRYAEELQP
jgi:ABC-2 type transport system permease protein